IARRVSPSSSFSICARFRQPTLLLDYAAGNRPRFDELHKRLAASQLNFFVGAGLSIPCGMPGWTGFLTDLGKTASIESEIAALLAKDIRQRTVPDHGERAQGSRIRQPGPLEGSAA